MIEGTRKIWRRERGSMNCSICKNRNIVKEYKLYNTNTKEITQWCQECLTKYATKNMLMANYMPKLRDTNIEQYNDTINDIRFIAEVYK